jgi:serine phosphatase RsbU (regulator of sigma subunit)/CheY-like chemotaxis protein
MSQGNGSKLKLMVVDDEPDNLDLLYRTFRRDFEVFKANSGLNALQALDQEGEMAIIISDQRMPGMNGTEFLSKTVARFPDTIRIVLTGYTDVEDLVEAINTGKVFKYITKPWMPDELKTVVQQAAETYQILKQRTNELQRALRRESLFNAMTTAIRESLDYRSMLQTIVETIGSNFEATYCILRPVESDRLTSEFFSYQPPAQAELLSSRDDWRDRQLQPDTLIHQALTTRQTQLTAKNSAAPERAQLVIPLTYQQELLAVLAIYQNTQAALWPPEDIQLIEGVAEQAALAISQAKLYQLIQEQTQQMRAELEVARQIQTNLLRQSWPDIEGAKIQAHCYPARQVGGDFFEVYVHPQGDIWLTVGDVSGKGVPAALFMASAISVLRRELAQEAPPEPNIVMQNLNSGLSEDLVSNNCFITMVLARYTPTTGQLVYANAGHIYPLVWSHQAVIAANAPENLPPEPTYLKTRGVPLGILPIWKAAAGSIVMSPGEVFLLTSDGITEATISEESSEDSTHPRTNSMLNQTGLWRLLTQERTPLNLNTLLERIQAHNSIQEDDQTILSLEIL